MTTVKLYLSTVDLLNELATVRAAMQINNEAREKLIAREAQLLDALNPNRHAEMAARAEQALREIDREVGGE